MSLKIFEKKRPMSFSPNDEDLGRMKAIVEANELSETISNSDFIRKALELAASPKELSDENVQSNEEFEGLKDEIALLKAENLELKTDKQGLLEKINAKPADLEEKQPVPPKPVEVQLAENTVAIEIDARMNKALLIRQKYGRSSSMKEMAVQAVQYCINQPIGNLFTGQW